MTPLEQMLIDRLSSKINDLDRKGFEKPYISKLPILNEVCMIFVRWNTLCSLSLKTRDVQAQEIIKHITVQLIMDIVHVLKWESNMTNNLTLQDNGNPQQADMPVSEVIIPECASCAYKELAAILDDDDDSWIPKKS